MRTIAVVAMSAALLITASVATPVLAATPDTWHVQVGSGTFGPSGFVAAGNAFYPGRIAVHQGDSIVFTRVSPHTITFNPPAAPVFAFFGPPAPSSTLATPSTFVSSNFDPTSTSLPPFTVTIGSSLSPGSYKYLCMLHVGMSGTIDVLPMSEALPKTDVEYAAIGHAQADRDLAKAIDIAAEAAENDEDEDEGSTVSVGAGNRRVTNLGFFPKIATVHVGQTINFVKTHDPTEPHTVTFGPEPAAGPFAPPVGGPPFVYDGSPSTQVHSGLLITRKQHDFYHFALVPGFQPQVDKVKITFTKAGTYQYICAIHDDAGMRATVVVLP